MYKKFIDMFVLNNLPKFLLIVFCITLSLSGFLISDNLSKNIQTLISNDAKPVLGGDIKIEANIDLNEFQLEYLENLEKESKILLSKKIQTYSTVFDNKNNPDLVSLVFVDDKYPLYGELKIENKTSGVFVTQNIADLFAVNNSVTVYSKKYDIGGIISEIPGGAINFFDDGKKILLDIKEFDLLKIESFGARLDRDYLIKVKNPKDFETILSDIKESGIFEGVRIRDYKKGADRFADIFSQLEKFIKYIGIISFILTVLIIFLGVESFYLSNKKNFSILRILGLKNINLIFFNILLFSFVLLISMGATVLIGEYIFSIIRIFDLSSNFYIDKFSILKTFVLGFIILLLSVLFPLFKFLSGNPLAGLKENFLQVYTKKEVFIEFILVFIGIIFIYSLTIGSLVSGIYFTIILFLFIFLISFLFKYVLLFFYKISGLLKKNYFSFYDSIRNTVKPGNLSLLISFSFIFSFTCLLFISIISLNFFDKLNINLNTTDNVYIININEKDLENIDEKYKKSSYSLIRGRILSVNSKPIKEHAGNSGRFSREFNITDSALEDIKLLEGVKIKSGEVSVDSDFSKDLKVGLGDEIEFLIYGINKKLVITNIREGIGDSIQPFFYFQVYKEDFKKFPKKYFLSTYIAKEDLKEFKSDFLEKTGSYISFIELDKIVTEVKAISKKVFIVIQVLFTYVFVFCVISLIVSILFLIPFKKKKLMLYSTLGASSSFINKNNFFEYIYLQSLSFILSLIVASSVAYYLLGKSSFINFGTGPYLISLGFVSLVFVVLIGVIRFFVGKNNKK